MTTVKDAASFLSAWDLQVIVSVAEWKTLIAAARALSVSQSSLSRTISKLEENLGVVLFARTTRRMDLTPAGQEFVSIAKRVLNDLRLAHANMQEMTSEKRGQVLISTYPQFAQEVLPSLVAEYRRDRPQTQVYVRTARNPDIVEDIHSGLADFGVTFSSTLPDNVECVTLRQDVLCALIPSTNPLAKSTTPLSFSRLEGFPLISLDRDAYTRKLIDAAAANVGVTLSHMVVVPGFFEQMKFTRAGVGISLVPLSTLPGPCPAHVTVRVLKDPQLPLSINLISSRERFMSAAATSFRALVIERFEPTSKARKAV